MNLFTGTVIVQTEHIFFCSQWLLMTAIQTRPKSSFPYCCCCVVERQTFPIRVTFVNWCYSINRASVHRANIRNHHHHHHHWRWLPQTIFLSSLAFYVWLDECKYIYVNKWKWKVITSVQKKKSVFRLPAIWRRRRQATSDIGKWFNKCTLDITTLDTLILQIEENIHSLNVAF